MAARTWKLFMMICLISVYSLTFVGLHYRFVYSFFLLSALLHVCGCILFELGMMKVVIPYDHGHKEVYNGFIMRTETEPKTAVFAKPTETVRRQNIWNRNNTRSKQKGFSLCLNSAVDGSTKFQLLILIGLEKQLGKIPNSSHNTTHVHVVL